IKGPDVGKQFELDTELVGVGRDSSNIVRLHDTEASRRHAEFRRRADGSFGLADLGSANGTFVNTRPVREYELSSGDHVQIGQSILVYTSSGKPPGDATKIADQIRMIPKTDETPSAIIKTIGEAEASRLLTRPGEGQSEWLKTRLANLGVMYEAVQAVS